MDEVFAEEAGNLVTDDVLWLLSDQQGTVRDVWDDNGTFRKALQYDSFGNVTDEDYFSESGAPVSATHAEAVDQHFFYTGQERDESTGLQQHDRRWYDPQLGRWLSEDPIGFDAGDPNLYRYVGNSPYNFTDPTGTRQAGNPLDNLFADLSPALRNFNFSTSQPPKLTTNPFASLASLPGNTRSVSTPATSSNFALWDAVTSSRSDTRALDLATQSIVRAPLPAYDKYLASLPPDLRYPRTAVTKIDVIPYRNLGQESRDYFNATAESVEAGGFKGNDPLSRLLDTPYALVGAAYRATGAVHGAFYDVVAPPSEARRNIYLSDGRVLHDPGGGPSNEAMAFQALGVGGTLFGSSSRASGNLIWGAADDARAVAPSNYPNGTFSITKQKMETYPTDVARPEGTYRLLTGEEYDLSRAAADSTNDAIRKVHNLRGSGFEIHEIKPVKFGGSPTDYANKTLIDSDLHRKLVTPWWNQLQREIEGGL